MYFPSDINIKGAFNNTWNWQSSVHNYITIRILMAFKKNLGCVVFKFIPTPCISDDIWVIIKIRRIKYRFMLVTIQIFIIELDSKIWCHSLGFQKTSFVTNVNYTHKSNVLFIPRLCPNFTTYSISSLWREFIVNGSATVISFLYV